MPVTYTALNLTTLALVTLDDIDADFFGKTAYVFPPTSTVLSGAPETTFQSTPNQFTITMPMSNGTSVQIALTGQWPAPLTLAQFQDINQVNAWLAAAGSIQIEEAVVVDNRGDGFRLNIDFDGEGPTVSELVTSWGETELVDAIDTPVDPVEPLAFEGTDGVDIQDGTALGDTLNGNGGDDRLNGLGDRDYIYGGEGMDRIDGGEGADYLFGGADGDLILGRAGDDLIYGEEGLDILRGGLGDDSIYALSRGQHGADEGNAMFGGKGDDLLLGAAGDDTLTGGKGRDRVQGFEGEDVLIAGFGKDGLYGNQDADTFVFQSGVIRGSKKLDANMADSDVVMLAGFTGLDASTNALTGQALSDAVAAAGIDVTYRLGEWRVDLNGEARLSFVNGDFANEDELLSIFEFG